jgi:nitroreductase
MEPMTVSQAVAARRSIRVFDSRPVDTALLRELLDKARQSPSGGNVQPWHATVLSGKRLELLRQDARAAMMKGKDGVEVPEYQIYPSDLPDPWRSRRGANGEAMYAALGIERADKTARMAAVARNFDFFGAPVGLLLHTPHWMGQPQWADLGMWLQTLMLLLVEAGLGSCAQEAWSTYPETVKRVAEIPADHIFFCGLAIGYPAVSAPINSFPNPRAPLDEMVRFFDE